MEEKLDKIIELLEKQNRLLERLEFNQTTNKFPVQQAPASGRGAAVDFEGMRKQISSRIPSVGAGRQDVQEMIRRAREEAEARIKQTVDSLSLEVGRNEE